MTCLAVLLSVLSFGFSAIWAVAAQPPARPPLGRWRPSQAVAWRIASDTSPGSWLTPRPVSVSPRQTKAWTSTQITVTGENFAEGIAAYVDSRPLSGVQRLNSNLLVATLPPLPAGDYGLALVNPGGQAGGLARIISVGERIYLPLIISKR